MKNRKKQQKTQNKQINWTSMILKLSLQQPNRSPGVRFWNIGSNLFLSFSVNELDDEEGNILRSGWQLVDEMRGIGRRIERETAKLFLRGIVSDIVMRNLKK